MSGDNELRMEVIIEHNGSEQKYVLGSVLDSYGDEKRRVVVSLPNLTRDGIEVTYRGRLGREEGFMKLCHGRLLVAADEVISATESEDCTRPKLLLLERALADRYPRHTIVTCLFSDLPGSFSLERNIIWRH